MAELKGQTLKEVFLEYASLVIDGEYQEPAQLDNILNSFKANRYGIVVYGSYGAGKTFIFEVLLRIIPPNHDLMFRKVNVLDVEFDYKEHGDGCIRRYLKGNILFDDLGSENRGSNYGKNVEVMEKIILMRYEMWKSKGYRTFFTTNLTEAELKERYTGRCFSRIYEMCDRYIMQDDDKRKLRNFKKYIPVTHDTMTDADREWQKHYSELKQKAITGPAPEKKTLGQRARESFGTQK